MSALLDPTLLEILVCPDCHGTLTEQQHPRTEAPELACTGCGLVYPVQEGIPVMLVNKARKPA